MAKNIKKMTILYILRTDYNMRKQSMIFYFTIFILLFLVGCSEASRDIANNQDEDNNTNQPVIEEREDLTNNEELEAEEDHSNALPYDESAAVEMTNDDETIFHHNTTNTHEEAEETLAQFSSEEIEYARIWLQLGVNQEIDELNVYFIPAGERVNPLDETSATYPEDVIQLTGSRLVDGSITYSGNGDGTINLYHVPVRWETNVPDDLDENYMYELTKEMIENTELVAVDVGDDEKVIELIKLLKIHR